MFYFLVNLLYNYFLLYQQSPLYNTKILQVDSSFFQTYSLKVHLQLYPISILINIIIYNIHQPIKSTHIIPDIIIYSKLIYGFCKSFSTEILANNGIYRFYLTLEWLSILKLILFFTRKIWICNCEIPRSFDRKLLNFD